MAKLSLEGQTIDVPDEIAQSDDALIRALTPLYPDVANAEIARKDENGETIITVVKRPGAKGGCAQVLQSLLDASSEVNPALTLCMLLRQQHVEQATPDELLALRERIETAIEAGEQQIETVRTSLKLLMLATPVPALHVPVGF